MKGYEIFKGIANKEIKDGTQFRMLEDNNIYTYRNNNFVCKYGGMNVIAILNQEFEIIEEQQEIDIQKIKEFDKDKARKEIFTYTGPDGKKSNLYCFSLFTESRIIPKINELVQAVKQLDKNKKNKE